MINGVITRQDDEPAIAHTQNRYEYDIVVTVRK
jgi:hypothetical protein